MVGLCFNTEQGFLKALSSYANPDLLFLRYNFGDWLYQRFTFTSIVAEAELDAISHRLDFNVPTDYAKWEELLAQLMQVCHDALHQFQTTEVYQSIPKEPNFMVLCLDHDESIENIFSLNKK